MKKFTKEQADYFIEKLIRRLKGAADDYDPIAYHGMYHPNDVNNIVKKCITEEIELPE